MGLAQEITRIARRQVNGKVIVLGLVGPGNNGGDTLISLCHLVEQEMDVSAYLINRKTVDDGIVEQFIKMGGKVYASNEDNGNLLIKELIAKCDILVDGVIGTGLKLPLKPEFEIILKDIKGHLQAIEFNPIVIAVDCPSGIDCDTGEVSEYSIPADFTFCMAAVKQGLLKLPAFEYVGRIGIVEIGLNEISSSLKSISCQVADEGLIRSLAIKRPLDAHKGTFGTALIVAGSLNYTGAALLAGKAAYRVGVGLVTLGIPSILHSSLSGHFPEATWLLLPHEMGSVSGQAAKVLTKNIAGTNALLIGCGMGVEDTTYEFLEKIILDTSWSAKDHDRIGFIQNTKSIESKQNHVVPPLVIDADGLKLLARIPDWSKFLPENSILTPHVGEMEILTGVSKKKILSNRMSVAEHFAREWRQIVVLKGAFTIIASPDGLTTTIPVATPALSRAGSGDVLAGMIVGFRAQGMEAYQSAIAGSWYHAKAGILASEKLGGAASVIAGDIIDSISGAISLVDF
jgi:NAD(P)H-hydrate epimerase